MGSAPESPESGTEHPQEPHDKGPELDPPPVFTTWKHAYLFVIGFLILLIILFYLFTIRYT